MEEIWKEIDHSPDYECSNLGNFRRKNPGKGTRIGNPVKVFINSVTGYCSVTLANPGTRTFAAHKIIARAFVDNPNHYKFVMFKDGNPQNLRADNLYWAETTASKKRIPIWSKHTITGEIVQWESKLDFIQKMGVSYYGLSLALKNGARVNRYWQIFDKNPALHT